MTNTAGEKDSVWLAEDTIKPVHHCSNDDRRDFLVDTVSEEVVSTKQADEIALSRLEASPLGEQMGENFRQNGVTSQNGKRKAIQYTAAAASVLVAANALPRMAFAAGSNKTLVVVFLRGGIDGLFTLGPWQDATYKAKRKTTILDPAKGDIQLDNTFALHKSMQPLMQAWNDGHLSFAHAVGDTQMTRSHFDEQARVDRMAPVEVRTGWLARRQMSTMSTQSPFRSYAANTQTPLSLQGDFPVFSTPNFNEYKIYDDGNATNTAVQRTYARLQGIVPFEAMGLFNTLNVVKGWAGRYTPANGAKYSGTSFGRQMAQVAQVIKAGVGLEVATVDFESFDDHGGEQAALGDRLSDLATNLAAFYQDMGTGMDNVTLMTQSEFGRTTRENGIMGTDHGRGNMMLCLSNKAAPKKIAGTWPTLSPGSTDANGDLEVTTDHRDVAAEILSKHLGDSASTISTVLNGYSPKPVGLLR